MAIRAATPAGLGDRRSPTVRRALRRAASGRAAPAEREWLSRIRERRRELASEQRVGEILRASAGASAPDSPGRLAAAFPWMSTSHVWGHFLMCLVRELAPRSCLELGAGFGISGAYQGAGLELSGSGRLITLDFTAELAAIAAQGFIELGLGERVEVRQGPIDATLGGALRDAAPIDYAFLDADHAEEATVDHFDALLPALAPAAVVVVDDIRWSDGMRRAWGTMRSRDRVGSSASLGRMGAVVIS